MAVNLEAIRKKVAQLNGERTSRVQLWKPGLGEHRIRILPWPDATPEQPIKELYFYYLGRRFPILAPFQFGKPDPINDLIKQLYATRKEEDKEIAKKIKPGMAGYVRMIDRANEKEGVVVWKFGKQAYSRLLSFYYEDEIGDYTDPGPDGWDIKVNIVPNKGGFSKTKIGQIDIASRKPSVLSSDPEQAALWIKNVPNIADMYQLKSPAEIKGELEAYLAGDEGGPTNDSEGTSRGQGEEDPLDKVVAEVKALKNSIIEDDEDEESKPAPKKPSRRATKEQPKEEDDDGGTAAKLDKEFDDILNSPS